MAPTSLDAILADIPRTQQEFLQRQKSASSYNPPEIKYATAYELHHHHQDDAGRGMGTKRKFEMVEGIEESRRNGVAATDGARLLAGGEGGGEELARINERPWSEESQKVGPSSSRGVEVLMWEFVRYCWGLTTTSLLTRGRIYARS